uniref:Uncharacterized protein n=1 Tax=Arion vulgaris TaxID=1028688 RepID=A0A0B7A5M8_9EUPU
MDLELYVPLDPLVQSRRTLTSKSEFPFITAVRHASLTLATKSFSLSPFPKYKDAKVILFLAYLTSVLGLHKIVQVL